MRENGLSFDRRLDRTSLILVVLFSTVAYFLYSSRAALSFAVGGVTSTVNFHWLKQAVDFIVQKGAEGRIGKRIALQYAGRYALIALILYVTIRFSFLDPGLVLAGLLVYVLAVLLESIIEIAKSLIRDYRNARRTTSDR